jgi:hypothetical protein
MEPTNAQQPVRSPGIQVLQALARFAACDIWRFTLEKQPKGL